MKKNFTSMVLKSLCISMGMFIVTSASAQTYPDRAIKILQGFAPGGNADAIARSVGTEMAKTLGQAVVVDAQAGAGGTIAATTVAKSKPDGYTLLLATGGHAVAGAIYNNLNYKTVQDFEMISTITYFPFLIVVNANSKITDFSELLRQAKANPGKLAYGTAGIGSTHHLAGDVPFIIAPPTAVLSNIKGGKLKAIAATGPQRWSGMPEVPTVAEQGVPGYDVRSWAGLMAPAGTPKPIIDKLNAEALKAIQLPNVKSRLEEMGGDVRGSTSEEMRAMVASETQKWTQVVNIAKIPKQ